MKDFNRIKGDHTWQDDLKKTNPGYWDLDERDEKGKGPHTVNCQRCITAYEARRRGFDAEADVVLSDSQSSAYGWFDSFGIKAGTGEHPGHEPNSTKPMTAEKLRKNTDVIMLRWGSGSRAVISCNWKNTDVGHVFIAENHNGVIRYIDPQSGTEDYSYAFEEIHAPTMTIHRIDDKPFQEQAARWCVRP